MIDYDYTNVMLPKPTHAALKRLQSETGASIDTILTLAANGLLAQLADKSTKEKKAALGIK